MTQLIQVDKNEAIINPELLGELSKGGMSFLPRIQVVQPTSGVATEEDSDVRVGDIVFIKGKEKPIKLGKTMITIPITSRPKAINYNNEPPLAYYTPTLPAFKETLRRALEGGPENQGFSGGYEVLMWVPEVKDFATFHLGSKTLRPLITDYNALLGTAAKSTTKVIKGKNTFAVVNVSTSNEPVELPSDEQLALAKEQFMNLKDSSIEQVAESEAPDSSRD